VAPHRPCVAARIIIVLILHVHLVEFAFHILAFIMRTAFLASDTGPNETEVLLDRFEVLLHRCRMRISKIFLHWQYPARVENTQAHEKEEVRRENWEVGRAKDKAIADFAPSTSRRPERHLAMCAEAEVKNSEQLARALPLVLIVSGAHCLSTASSPLQAVHPNRPG